MRRHGRGRELRFIAFACLALIANGCANLTAIREFANTSSDAAQYSQLVVAYVDTPSRMKRYEPESQLATLDRQVTERKTQQERLLLRQKLIQEYMDALGQLAGDELTIYDKELDALGKAAKTANFLEPGEATAFAAVSKVLVLAVTDRWRQGKLVTLIEETDGPFQVVVGALVKVVEQEFAADTANEREALNKYYTALERQGRDAAGLAALAEWREVREGQIKGHEVAIRNYAVVLKTIAVGHHKLYESRHRLSRPEVQAEIHQYTKRLKEAFNALAAL
jgi:hypothetical protein